MKRDKQEGSPQETSAIPTPKVIIDLDSDPDATVVEVTFGDRLGALLDTVKIHSLMIRVLSAIAASAGLDLPNVFQMNALKNLGLNVVKANVCLDSSGKHNKFAITKA